MSNKLRECVNKLHSNKEVGDLLPEYLKQSMILHDGYTRIKLMMEYYMFYEVVTEDINPYIAMAKEMITSLNETVGQAMSDTLDDTEKTVGRSYFSNAYGSDRPYAGVDRICGLLCRI